MPLAHQIRFLCAPAVYATIIYSILPLHTSPIHILPILPSLLAEKIKAAKAWSIWEGRISKLVQDPVEDMKHGDEQFALAFARIENHYFTNKGFFPRYLRR